LFKRIYLLKNGYMKEEVGSKSEEEEEYEYEYEYEEEPDER
jgi:hypothetical protein